MKSKRKFIILGLVVLLGLTAAGCNLPVRRAGASCAKNGAYAQDGTHVLKCEKGRWKRGITTAVADAALQTFLNQQTPAAPAPAPAPAPTESVSQRNAREKAASYLSHMSFSRQGLIDQLLYEKFNLADATYGTDAQNADWNLQAAKKAASYLSHMSFSRQGLIDQLLYEDFTQAQAEYGVSTTGL